MDEMYKYKVTFLFIFFVLSSGACSQDSAERAAAGDGFGEEDQSNADRGMPMGFFRECAASNCNDFETIEGEKTDKDAASWHPRAAGIRLVGDPAMISVSDDFAAHPEADWTCYNIFVLGGWDDSVTLKLRVRGEYGVFGINRLTETLEEIEESDAAGETFTLVEKITNNEWAPFELSVRTLAERGQITFSLEKEGDGDARFYYIEISGSAYCMGDAVELD